MQLFNLILFIICGVQILLKLYLLYTSDNLIIESNKRSKHQPSDEKLKQKRIENVMQTVIELEILFIGLLGVLEGWHNSGILSTRPILRLIILIISAISIVYVAISTKLYSSKLKAGYQQIVYMKQKERCIKRYQLELEREKEYQESLKLFTNS